MLRTRPFYVSTFPLSISCCRSVPVVCATLSPKWSSVVQVDPGALRQPTRGCCMLSLLSLLIHVFSFFILDASCGVIAAMGQCGCKLGLGFYFSSFD